MDENRPWKRRDGEPERSYRLFLTYLGMGPRRSLRKVAECVDAPCLRVLERKSRRWSWRDRAAAFDFHEIQRIERALLNRVRRQRSDTMRARLQVSTTATMHALKAAKAVEETAGTFDLKTLEGIRQLNATMDVIKKAYETIGLSYLDVSDLERNLDRACPDTRQVGTDSTSMPEDMV